MSVINFDTVVIYDIDGPVGVIYGQHSELYRTLQKHEIWESMSEELQMNGEEEIDNIDSLQEILNHGEFEFIDYSYRIKVFENQSYSKPNTKKLKY